MNQRLGMLAAILTLGALSPFGQPALPVVGERRSYKSSSYDDPKRMGHKRKTNAKNKRLKEIAKASRKRNRAA